jgi:hypothetical protein
MVEHLWLALVLLYSLFWVGLSYLNCGVEPVVMEHFLQMDGCLSGQLGVLLLLVVSTSFFWYTEEV